MQIWPMSRADVSEHGERCYRRATAAPRDCRRWGLASLPHLTWGSVL